MKYLAIVRLRKWQDNHTLKFRARDIKEAAEVVRAKYGFDTGNPHNGFTITEDRP